MLSTRIVTAVVLIALVLAALFLLPPLGWALLSLAVIAVGAHEWAALARVSARGAMLYVVTVIVLGLVLLWLERAGARTIVVLVCGAATLFWLLVVPPWLRARWTLPSAPVALAIGGLLLLSAWLAIAVLQAQSPGRLLAAMAIVWIADTAAYFTGRSFGRHKLAPAISPGKTWEGVAGGLVGVMVYAAVVVSLWPEVADVSGPTGTIVTVLFAVAVGALSVCGDLFESLQKRQAGVKDSGSLLPGHGGVLDRVDALLAAMPPIALAAVLALR